MTDRENWLRTIEFRCPEWIPVTVAISPATRLEHGEALRAILEKYPRLVTADQSFPPDPHQLPGRYRAGAEFVDEWGCRWANLRDGLEGQVIDHPLADWAAWKDYQLPDPLSPESGWPSDWEAEVRRIKEAKERGQLAWGSADRFFERLIFLRGFENLMIDLAENSPMLAELMDALVEYILARVHKWVEAGVDIIAFGDDFGLQDRPMVSPETFRRWFKPAYEKMMRPAREAGIHVKLHSDGYTLPLLPIFIEMGASVVNPQDLVNGLDNIASTCKGKVCVLLDIDRQRILPFGRPEEVRAHIRRCVETLYLPEGGLAMIIGIYPDVPLENIDAVLSAFYDYCLDISWLQ
ncbi:MAG: hypothetical protein H5T86_03735 [Armatimonadetes bacterium]|nr:hypothetical protein [Armatimonadota bacterium]